jgi:hypothetical protein
MGKVLFKERFPFREILVINVKRWERRHVGASNLGYLPDMGLV